MRIFTVEFCIPQTVRNACFVGETGGCGPICAPPVRGLRCIVGTEREKAVERRHAHLDRDFCKQRCEEHTKNDQTSRKHGGKNTKEKRREERTKIAYTTARCNIHGP